MFGSFGDLCCGRLRRSLVVVVVVVVVCCMVYDRHLATQSDIRPKPAEKYSSFVLMSIAQRDSNLFSWSNIISLLVCC